MPKRSIPPPCRAQGATGSRPEQGTTPKPSTQETSKMTIISDDYRADIAAVQADPIAIAMAAELPEGVEPPFLAALREYQRRGGIHGTTHMGAVLAALRNLRAAV